MVNQIHKNAEFEYLGLSAFWGIINFMLFIWIYRKNLQIANQIMQNQFVAGLALSLIGIPLGALGSQISRLKKDIEAADLWSKFKSWIKLKTKHP